MPRIRIRSKITKPEGWTSLKTPVRSQYFRLIKALIGLVLGFLIGLIFGKQIVGLIASPMEGALQTFYTEEVTENLKQTLTERGIDEDEIP